MISHALPFSSPAQLTMCPPANHTLGEERKEEEERRKDEKRGEEEGGGKKEHIGWAVRLSPTGTHTHTLTHIHIYVHAINTCADNELHSDDHMTRWRLCVIWIVYDRRQRQSAEQTPGLMRECLLCNTSQTQQHLFFYSGLSLPGSSDTEIPC